MIKGFDLLEIDEKSGDLRTRIPIDREALCGRRESPDCIFEAEIITKPQSLFKLFSPNRNAMEKALIYKFCRNKKTKQKKKENFGFLNFSNRNNF